MTEIVIIITCIVVVTFIAYNFFKGKNVGDNSLLSTQLADLIVRFSKVEEATKNISSTQTSIDSTFKNFQSMLDDRQERGAFSEMELEKLLKDRLPSQYLKFQYTLSNNKRVDCLIDLGENSQKIGIDSKFVLDNYKYLRSAKTEDEIKKYNDYCEENTKNSKDLKSLFELVSKVKINNLKLREYACREKIIKDIICKITNNDIIFDDMPNLFCFKNKIFDLDLNKEIEPKPEYYLTMTTTYDYIEKDYSIEVNELKEIIKNCMPDDDVRTLYLKVLSSTMYGVINQKFIVCSGE
jgi:phage/plasmid-associated DNA primase